MNKYWKQICSYTFAVTTGSFAFIPEESFSLLISWSFLPSYWNETVNKILFLILVGLLISIAMCLWQNFRRKITLKGQNYKITIRYGDIFELSSCKKVISFDECFNTEIGNAPHEIKPSSICGQFLQRFPNIDVNSLLSEYQLKPQRKLSEFGNKECYKLGTIIPNNEYLLMAFGKLNKDGRATMEREEYLAALSALWKEIDKYDTQSDVAIPVLGAGITRFKGELLTQQQLIDIIIASYKISPYKIKLPNSLHIICKEREDFCLDKIGNTL